MIADEQIYVGNKFKGDINNKLFTIKNIKKEAGQKWVYVECDGKIYQKNYQTFKHLLLTEVA